MATVTLIIDGREITVEKGTTILQAALANGISVPYYCYHPGLGVDGSCRVCIVKVQKMPKLQTACSTACGDGMVVETRTPEVVDARAAVFEFLLINHPLDCPVCDKGGECPLQDFSYSFGPAGSRMEFPRRVFDGEGVKADVDFGPTLMLNRNRCILCTRCVRFMREIDGDAQIGIIDRGSGSEIATFEEEGIHSLLSGNLMDVCPVGAITTKDYRFKSRPWDNPGAVDTICTYCSRGCNTTVWLRAKPEWAKGARLVRMTPRFNPDVNGYWMCDIGRFDYHWIEGADRLKRPLVGDDRGTQQEATWDEALRRLQVALTPIVATSPGAVRVLVSGHAALEELFVVRRLARELLGEEASSAITISWRYREKPQPASTKFPVPPVDAPNIHGAKDLGLLAGSGSEGPADLSALKQAVASGRVKAVYVLDPGPGGSIGDTDWLIAARTSGLLSLLVVHGVLRTPLAAAADIVLPGSCAVEKEALFVNEQGLVQTTNRSVAPPGDALEDWRVLVSVSGALGKQLPYTTIAEIRSDIANALSDKPAYASIAGPAATRPVEHWLQASNPSERLKWEHLFKDLPPEKFAKPVAPSPAETGPARPAGK